MSWINLLPIPIAYLLGSIPAAFLVAKYNGRIDIRDEGDGHISAAAVYRRVGLLSFMIVVILDIGKAALSVLIAQWLGAEPAFIMLAGLFAMVAHQWSPFLKFQGGLGATTTGGILVCIATVPTLIGAVIAILILIKTKKSTWAFAIGILVIAIVLFAMQWSNVPPPPILIAPPSLPPPFTQYQLVVAYPIILGLSQVFKAYQIKHCPGSPLNVK